MQPAKGSWSNSASRNREMNTPPLARSPEKETAHQGVCGCLFLGVPRDTKRRSACFWGGLLNTGPSSFFLRVGELWFSSCPRSGESVDHRIPPMRVALTAVYNTFQVDSIRFVRKQQISVAQWIPPFFQLCLGKGSPFKSTNQERMPWASEK